MCLSPESVSREESAYSAVDEMRDDDVPLESERGGAEKGALKRKERGVTSGDKASEAKKKTTSAAVPPPLLPCPVSLLFLSFSLSSRFFFLVSGDGVE